MKVRILLGLAAMVAIVSGAIWFSASESYVLTLRAEVATALDVNPHGDLDWHVVFSNTTRNTAIEVGLSSAALAELNKTCATGENDPDTGAPIFEPCPNIAGVDYQLQCNNPASDSICRFLSVDDEPFFNKVSEVKKTFRFKVGTANLARKHVISFAAPACEDAHQKNPSENDIACSQDSSVVLTGAVSIIRVDIQTVGADKCDLTNKKDESPTNVNCDDGTNNGPQ